MWQPSLTALLLAKRTPFDLREWKPELHPRDVKGRFSVKPNNANSLIQAFPTLTKNGRARAQGMLGETIGAVFFDKKGFQVSRANGKNAYSNVDLAVQNKEGGVLMEVKTAAADKSAATQHWRVNVGGAQLAFLRAKTPAHLRDALFKEAEKRAIQHKKLAVSRATRKTGKLWKGGTLGVIIDYKNRDAYLYLYEGFHRYIGWNDVRFGPKERYFVGKVRYPKYVARKIGDQIFREEGGG